MLKNVPETGTCTVLLSANTEVQANFEEPVQQTLTTSVSGEGSITSAPAGISCPGSCSEHFNEGRLVTLTAAPDPHNKLLHWSGCASEPTPTQCRVAMSAAETVKAEFAPIPQQTLTISKIGSGAGLVKSYPAGISCPGTCSASFDEGATVYLVPTPAPTAVFNGWSGGGCSGGGVCQVVISGAQSLNAEFIAAPQAQQSALGTSIPASLALRSLAAAGSRALSATVSGAGTLATSSADLKRVEQYSNAAGSVTLHLRLNRVGRRALARAGKPGLRVRVMVIFTPSVAGAGAALATKTVTFRAEMGRPQASRASAKPIRR